MRQRHIIDIIFSDLVLVVFEGIRQLRFGLATSRTVMGSTSRLDPLTAGGASNSHDVWET